MAPIRSNERDEDESKKKPAQRPKKIPRPPNAWILYRTARMKEIKEYEDSLGIPHTKQSDISRTLGDAWKIERDDIRQIYEKAAAIAKEKHKKKYPNYKYRPRSKEEKRLAREEAKAAKKRAQEEAKAAKAAGRKASGGRSTTTSSGEASSSAVKLEDLEPVSRGSGPSPPLDSDDESSLVSSTPSLPSDTEVHRNFPSVIRDGMFPSHIVAPGPSYPIRFFSNGFLPGGDYVPSAVSTAASLPASTPGDSPPSYTEGGPAQLAPYGYMSVPQLAMAHHSQDMTSGFTPGLADFAAWVANTICVPPNQASTVVPRFPPGEVEMDVLAPPPPIRGQPSSEELFNEDDRLAPALDIAEFHGTIDDLGHSQALISPDAAAVLDSSQPFSLEEVLAFGIQHPEVAANEMDPSISFGYYSAEAAHTYSDRVAYPQFEPPYAIDPAPLPPYSATPMDFALLSPPIQQEQPPAGSVDWLAPELLEMFNSQLVAPLLDPATSPSFQAFMSGQSSFSSPVESPAPAPLDTAQQPSGAVNPQQLVLPANSRPFPSEHFVNAAAASQPVAPQNTSSRSTYVPPGGARLPPRRRVGARHAPRLSKEDEPSMVQPVASGSGLRST